MHCFVFVLQQEYEDIVSQVNRLVRLGFILVEDYSVQRIPGEKKDFSQASELN